MNRIRIGIMGCADIARRLTIPAIQLLPEYFEIIAISSRSEVKAKAFAGMFNIPFVVGYQELIENKGIDAIYIPLPSGLHKEWVIKALLGGKHVLVEKSLAMNFDDCNEMIELAKSLNLLILENFMFKYHSQHQAVWDALKLKSIGNIRLFRAQFGFPPLSEDNFRYDREIGGGALLDVGAYTLKASQWFLGNHLRVLSSVLYVNKQSVDIVGNASLINENGLIAQVSFGFDNYYECNYEIWGSKGRIFAERAYTPKPNEEPPLHFEYNGNSTIIKAKADNHFRNIFLEFYNTILMGKYTAHLDDALNQSKLLSDLRSKAEIVEM